MLRRLSSLFKSAPDDAATGVAAAPAAAAVEPIVDGEQAVSDILLTAQSGVAAVAFDRAREMNIVVTMKAPTLADTQRVPVDITLVVDRSGSMSSVMSLVIECIEFIILNLGKDDRLSIIDYDHQVTTTLKLTKMDKSGKKRAASAAKSLTARGGTDLAGGLFHGLKQVQQRPQDKDSNDVASILLFTDGQANQGITDPNIIFAKMRDPEFIANYKGGEGDKWAQTCNGIMSSMSSRRRQQRCPPPTPPPSLAPQQQQQQQQQHAAQSAPPPAPPAPSPHSPPPYAQVLKEIETPVKISQKQKVNMNTNYTVNTFGFSRNHNENLLRGIAECGNGLYFFIENKEVLGDAFVDCIGGILSVVGQGLALEISPGEGVEISDVLTHYPKKRGANGNMRLQIKDIQSEESRDIVCTVKLPQLEEVGTGQVLRAKLEYDNVITSTKTESSTILSIPRPAPSDSACEQTNLYVDEQLNRMITATAIKDAADLADKHDFNKAKSIIITAIEKVQHSPSAKVPYCAELVTSMQETSATFSNRSHYSSFGGKAARAKVASHQYQRSNLHTKAQYHNMKKSAMMSAWKSFKS